MAKRERVSVEQLQSKLSDANFVWPSKYVSRLRSMVADGRLKTTAKTIRVKGEDGKPVDVSLALQRRGGAVKHHKKPTSGFSEVLSFSGERLPPEQHFVSDDQHFLYVSSRRNWLKYELGVCEKELSELVKLSKEERIAKAASMKADREFNKAFGSKVEAAKTDPKEREKLLAMLKAAGMLP